MNVKEEEKNDGYLLFATRRGIVKDKFQFSNIRTNGIKAILLNDGDELFEVSVTDGEKDIIWSF